MDAGGMDAGAMDAGVMDAGAMDPAPMDSSAPDDPMDDASPPADPDGGETSEDAAADAGQGADPDCLQSGSCSLELASLHINDSEVPLQAGDRQFEVVLPAWSSSVVVTPVSADGGPVRVAGDELPSGVPSPAVLLRQGRQRRIEVIVEREGQQAAYSVTLRQQGVDAHYVKGEPEAGSEMGTSIATDGPWLVIGVPGDDHPSTEASGAPAVCADVDSDCLVDAGIVYVYRRDGDAWSLHSYLHPGALSADLRFGAALAIHGDTLIVGAPGDQGSEGGVGAAAGDDCDAETPVACEQGSGAAFVYEFDGQTWRESARLKAEAPTSDAQFGRAISLWGDTAVVGAPMDRSDGVGAHVDELTVPVSSYHPRGSLHVFRRGGGGWQKEAFIQEPFDGDDRLNIGISAMTIASFFGDAVDLRGDVLAVGAHGHSSAGQGLDEDMTNDCATLFGRINCSANSGAVYILRREGDTWTFEAAVRSAVMAGFAAFGSSLALGDDQLVVGETRADCEQEGTWGSVQVFARGADGWSLSQRLCRERRPEGVSFGVSVAWSDGLVAAGDPQESSAATGIDGDDRPDCEFDTNCQQDAGAVHLFRLQDGQYVPSGYVKAGAPGAVRFGSQVVMSGGRLAAGATHDDSAAQSIDGDPISDCGGESLNCAEASGAVWVLDPVE